MRFRLSRAGIARIAIGVGIIHLGSLPAKAQAAEIPPRILLQECELRSSGGNGSASARCGWYEVAENRDHSAGKRIRIHVAVIPALRRQPLPDPVFVLSGGPGQAASDFYLSSSHAFDQLRRQRDLVIVDQRGTGQSNRLDCRLPDELENEHFDAEAMKESTRECLDKLPGDPRYYGTSTAVRDLDEIRIGLGYDKINLYGISYGTRVAQHYLRRHEDHVRSVVLDGVVPVEVALGPEVAPAAQQALDAIVKRCSLQPECQKAFPDIQTEILALRERVARTPISMDIADPTTGLLRNFNFGATQLAVALRLYSYSDDTASLLPFFIHEAAQGRPEALAAQALMVARDLSEQLANGMHNAVICTEDVPFFTAAALNNPAIGQSYLRRDFIETLQSMCSVWPQGVIDSSFHVGFSSDVPTLLLSGENDPVTPASYGERSLKNFPNGKHLIVPGQGHGQLNNPCIMQLMTRFIEAGSGQALDIKCVAKQTAAAFMLNATSPGP